MFKIYLKFKIKMTKNFFIIPNFLNFVLINQINAYYSTDFECYKN